MFNPPLYAYLDDWGHALEWPDGLDVGADRLYELCREQAELPTAGQICSPEVA